MKRTLVKLISDAPFFSFGICSTLQRHYSFAVYTLYNNHREATNEIIEGDGHASFDNIVVIFHCRSPEHVAQLKRLLTHNKTFPLAVFFSSPHYEMLELAAKRRSISVFDETAGEEELIRGIKEACAGNAYFSDSLGESVVRSLRANGKGPFTSRELDIISLVATGMTLSAVAALLGVSPHTVRNHLANIYEKLGAGNRTSAVVKALEMGIIQGPRSRE